MGRDDWASLQRGNNRKRACREDNAISRVGQGRVGQKGQGREWQVGKG